MIPVLALLVGAALGFVGSRRLRSPAGADAPERLKPMRPSPNRPPVRRQPVDQRGPAPQRQVPPTALPKPAAPRPLTPTALAVVRRDTQQRTPLGRGPLSIGRSSERDLTIDDDRVSRAHAHLELRGSGWFVVDDGSANGTTVNRSPLQPGQPRQVSAGDRIGIGPFDLDVVADGGIEGDERTRAYGS